MVLWYAIYGFNIREWRKVKMELPEIMLQHGVKIVSDEEYKEMCKIDERFCTSDDFETETKKEK